MLTRSYTAALEIRGDGRTITGLVAPYNSPATIHDEDGDYTETFGPDSFIPHGSGVPLYSDHPLGRAHDERDMPVTPPGEYRDNDTGLYGQWKVPHTPAGDELLSGIRSGRVRGLSVGFLPGADDEWAADRSSVRRRGALLHHVAAAVNSTAYYPEARILQVRSGKEPYGDVEYGDPGYQPDRKKRYPLDTEDHVHAALSYFGQAKNREPYTAEQVKAILGRIHAAAKRFGIKVEGEQGRSFRAPHPRHAQVLLRRLREGYDLEDVQPDSPWDARNHLLAKP